MKEIENTAPYSIRLKTELRTHIHTAAKALNLKDSEFIRCTLESEVLRVQSTGYQKKGAQHDPQAIGQVLAMLGQSRMANNLNQIAKAINTGTLIVTPEITQQLNEACLAIQVIRTSLIKGMGLKEG